MGWQDAPIIGQKKETFGWESAPVVEEKDIVSQIPTGITGVTEKKYEPSIAGTQPERTLGEKAIGAGEAAVSAVTGATTGALGYLGGAAKGIGQEIVTGEFGKGIAEREAAKGAEALTYVPRGEAGKEYVGKIGEAAQQLTPLMPLSAELTAISSSFKNLGPQLKRGVTLIDDMGEPTPILRKALDKQGLVYENLSPQSKSLIPTKATSDFIKTAKSKIVGITDKALVEQIKSGARDDALAGLKVSKGKVVPDKLANEAIRQGFDPGFVQAVKTANKQTKESMAEMLSKMERITKNRRLALEFRPSDVAGNSALDRFKFIRNKANEARNQLNVIAKTKLKGKDVDTSPIVDQFSKSLDDLNITLKGDGVPVANFKGSQISKDRTSQRIINDAIDLMAEGGKPDALRLHNLKRQLDTMIDFRKESIGGLTEAGKNVLKDLRRSINDVLRNSDKSYKKINDVLHKSLTAMDDLKSAVGPSVANLDFFSPGAGKAMGTKLRALMSNQQKRIELETALNNLDATASELGGTFNTNYKDLILFANKLEDRFGAVAETSFKGDIESAIKGASTGSAKSTVTEVAASKIAETAERLRGVNDFNAFESMRDLLKGKKQK